VPKLAAVPLARGLMAQCGQQDREAMRVYMASVSR
jgi:hypothetical protein